MSTLGICMEIVWSIECKGLLEGVRGVGVGVRGRCRGVGGGLCRGLGLCRRSFWSWGLEF